MRPLPRPQSRLLSYLVVHVVRIGCALLTNIKKTLEQTAGPWSHSTNSPSWRSLGAAPTPCGGQWFPPVGHRTAPTFLYQIVLNCWENILVRYQYLYAYSNSFFVCRLVCLWCVTDWWRIFLYLYLKPQHDSASSFAVFPPQRYSFFSVYATYISILTIH